MNTREVITGKALDFKLQRGDIVYVSSQPWPWARAEELLDEGSRAFIEALLVTYTGAKIGPFIDPSFIDMKKPNSLLWPVAVVLAFAGCATQPPPEIRCGPCSPGTPFASAKRSSSSQPAPPTTTPIVRTAAPTPAAQATGHRYQNARSRSASAARQFVHARPGRSARRRNSGQCSLPRNRDGRTRWQNLLLLPARNRRLGHDIGRSQIANRRGTLEVCHSAANQRFAQGRGQQV